MGVIARGFLVVLTILIFIVVSVFLIVYGTRIRTIKSIRQLTDYQDGYNLYRIDIKYDYSLDDVINSGIHDNQSFADAVLKESIPLIPVNIKAPSYGCTAFTLKDSSGDIHMGRNYDFKDNTSSMLVFCSPEDGYKSVAFAALNNVSANVPDADVKKKLATLTSPFICLDGINEKGVSIAVLTLDSKPTYQETGKPVIATTLAIRLVLDRAATTQEAVELLKSYDMLATGGRDYHFYITDASGDGRVIEYECENEARSFTVTQSEAVTNFFICHKDKVLPNQKNGIYGHGMERYDAVLEVFKEEKGHYTNNTVWNALIRSSQKPNPIDITSNTQWSIAYNNSNLTAQIVIRRNWNDITEYFLDTNSVDQTFREEK